MLLSELDERQVATLEIGTRMARSDIYERYPALFEGDLAAADLSPADPAVRAELQMAYDAERRRQAAVADELRAIELAKRKAAEMGR